MFQPAPRRHRRLPTGTTMVSYAEVKSYLSKREIPQLFESLMAGLMYHRPENHIGYLQSCLEEVNANSETKVQWSTFVNAKKRKSKEILPPLTPKKQDSVSSSWSDNSRQSTPLPPISARTRTRTSLEQQDYRNTYILYHNPPPILAKPKVPVVTVLGGLGTRIDELCERVVGRLRGVVHISTCSMLKTRMTIEGFYRMTSVPACAVVDSVLQAMSMVQSANALLVAGFPRNRGDIEEYKSRHVRMDGVILVDFEEEALRHFLEHEVASGVVRKSEVDAELERFKQDIISVAEYYDEKDLLTVVMGDQDSEEIIDDLVLAVDKVIEARKNLVEEDTIDGKKGYECQSPCNVLVPSPERMERPSTVEIREATEEDIKSIEEEAKKTKASDENDEEVVEILSNEKGDVTVEAVKSENDPDELSKELLVKDEQQFEIENREINEGTDEEKKGNDETVDEEESKKDINEIDNTDKEEEYSKEDGTEKEGSEKDKSKSNEAKENEKAEESDPGENDKKSEEDMQTQEKSKEDTLSTEKPDIPLIFAFENVNVDYDEIKNLIANDLEMCFIDFQELMRNDGSDSGKFDSDEALGMLNSILKQDSVSYSNGFFIYQFPFSLLGKNYTEQLIKLGNLSFVCKIRENKPDSETEDKEFEEEKLFQSSINEKVRIIFVTESNAIEELRTILQELTNNKNTAEENIPENGIIKETNENIEENLSEAKKETEEGDDKIVEETENKVENNEKEMEENILKTPQNEDENKDVVHENEEVMADDKTEDSTGKDIEDLISDDTLNEDSKPADSLKTEENKDNPGDADVDDTHSQASTIASVGDETQKERAVLERQMGVEIETDNVSHSQAEQSKKPSLIRQSTYSTGEEMKNGEREDENVKDSNTEEAINSISAVENKGELLQNSLQDENANNDDAVSQNNEQTENDSIKNEEADDNVSKSENGNNKETDMGENGNNNETEAVVDEETKEDVVSADDIVAGEQNKEAAADEQNKETEADEEITEIVPDEEKKEIIMDEESNETAADEENKEAETMEGEEDAVSESKEATENEVSEGKEATENKETENVVDEDNKETETVEGEDDKVSEGKEDGENEEAEGKEATENGSENKETKSAEDEGNKEITNEEDKDHEEIEEAKSEDNKEVETEKDEDNKETEATKDEDNKETEETKDEDNKETVDSETKAEVLDNEQAVEVTNEEENTDEKESEQLDSISAINDENKTSVNDEPEEKNSNSEEKAEITKSETEEDNQSNADNDSVKSVSEKKSENESNEAVDCDNVEEPGQSEAKSEESPDAKSELKEESELPEEKSEKQNTDEEDKSIQESPLQKDEKHAVDEKDNLEQKSEDIKNTANLLSVSNANMRKVIDDSDSNDENITIETKAEIHAVDSASPTVEAQKSESSSIHRDDIENQDIENEDAHLYDNSSGNNKPNDIALNKENVQGNEPDALSTKEIDSIGGERFSGKRQERNGSGILDESREQDDRESEEPQERSSSSSRGEL